MMQLCMTRPNQLSCVLTYHITQALTTHSLIKSSTLTVVTCHAANVTMTLGFSGACIVGLNMYLLSNTLGRAFTDDSQVLQVRYGDMLPFVSVWTLLPDLLCSKSQDALAKVLACHACLAALTLKLTLKPYDRSL